mmetsp:Transcript_121130/g.287769  ORF Transcript_121130/g.287769 Transcript_121130/m.287769 type:complete len:81 (-) Transcript_121130:72-314(-)
MREAPYPEEVPFPRFLPLDLQRAMRCKPCMYHLSKRDGCWKGSSCLYCHACTVEEMNNARHWLYRWAKIQNGDQHEPRFQ